jgi:hypothetical protein
LTNNSFINQKLNSLIYKGDSIKTNNSELNSKYYINSKNQNELGVVVSKIENELIQLYNKINIDEKNLDFNIEIAKTYIMVSTAHKNYKIVPNIYDFLDLVKNKL